MHETGEAPDRRAYIVMQYVEGESLGEVLRQGPLPVLDALLLCQRIAEALAWRMRTAWCTGTSSPETS